jgi:hypothetical protein
MHLCVQQSAEAFSAVELNLPGGGGFLDDREAVKSLKNVWHHTMTS